MDVRKLTTKLDYFQKLLVPISIPKENVRK